MSSPNVVRHFDSVGELVSYTVNGDRNNWYWHEHANLTNWLSAGLTQEECINRAINGDTELVERAQLLLDELSTPEVIGEVWSPSVAGCYPSIPDYLSGNPECMRMKVSHESERAPVRVYVSQFVSGSISAKQAIKRGIAITALVMHLQVTHPVELFLVSAFRNPDRIVCTRVGTLPIDLSTLAFNLAHVSMFRRFGIPAILENWPASQGSSAMPSADVKKHLTITGQDLYIESSVSSDGIIQDPLKWINDQVERFNREEN